MDTYAYDAGLPCKNPYCKSHGRPHPNCHCYSHLAEGGEVHFCSKGLAHHPECPHYAEGGKVESNIEFNQNPDLAVDHAVANHGLHHLMTKTGYSGSENPNKPVENFIEHSRNGSKKLDNHIGQIFEKFESKPDVEGTDALKQHLDQVQANPQQLLNVGGSLGQTLPVHSAAIGAKVANAVNYFQSIKPKSSQGASLNEVLPPSRMEQAAYERQLHVAQNPLHVLNNVKRGTVQPDDLKTLNTLYPQLTKKMISKATDQLVDAKTNDDPITYKQKIGLGALLGQPLDSTQTPAAMQAIIRSQPVAPPTQPKTGKKSGNGATAATQGTIEKTNQLYETPLERLQINRKD